MLFENDFEAGMTRLGAAQPDLLAPLQRAMAQFFFEFVPGSDSLYRVMARRMAETAWNGALVTLNYERLLQLSLEAEGVHALTGTEDKGGSAVEVCLPHGACHIFCDGVAAATGGIEFAGMEVETGGIPVVINSPTGFARRITSDPFPPVMSYFDPAKHTTSCVNFITEQRARYRVLVTGADRVAIVGVTVRPHDDHLWQPLAESAADLTFCAGEAAADVFLEWAESNRPGRVNQAYRSYFSESFDKICEAVGLESTTNSGRRRKWTE